MPKNKYTIGFHDFKGNLQVGGGIIASNCKEAIASWHDWMEENREDHNECEIAFVMNESGTIEYPKGGYTFKDGKLFLPSGQEV